MADDSHAKCEAVTDDMAFVCCLVCAEGSAEPVATGDATFMRGTRGRHFVAEPHASQNRMPPGDAG
jgi:hypothetical protein